MRQSASFVGVLERSGRVTPLFEHGNWVNADPNAGGIARIELRDCQSVTVCDGDICQIQYDVGWVMHATGAVALGAMIIAASFAFMWGGVWPTWAGWLGVVVGILSLASIAFFPQFLFLLWILVVSIVIFLQSRPASRVA